MTTIEQINTQILELTLQIKNHYPELTKYLDETNATIPDSDELTLESLVDYRDTLKSLINGYNETH